VGQATRTRVTGSSPLRGSSPITRVASLNEPRIDLQDSVITDLHFSMDIGTCPLGFRGELHRAEISLLDRAGREPRLGTIVKLADGLDIAPTSMLDGIG